MKKYTTYIAGLFFLAACQPAMQPEREQPIVCKAQTTGLSKGSGVTQVSSLQNGGLGLYAWYTDEGTAYGNTATPYLSNRAFDYDSLNDLWRGVTPSWWIPGGWLSFFAYAPYHADVSSGSLRFPSPDYVSGYPRIAYTPAALALEQEDLCLSAPVLNRSRNVNDGVVPLVFTHILTRVQLKAAWSGTAQGKSVRLEEVVIRGVVGSNRLTYNASSFLWDTPASGSDNASYTLSVSNGCFQSVGLPLADAFSSVFWNMEDPCLYVLPQQLGASAQMDVTYGIYDAGGTQESTTSVTLDIGSLAANIWPAGYEITYLLRIDVGGGAMVEADITYDCNAGCYVAPGTSVFDSSEAGTFAGSFLGGDFLVEDSRPGSYGSDGQSMVGSTAGRFN